MQRRKEMKGQGGNRQGGNRQGGGQRRDRNFDRREEKKEWIPLTELGKKVKAKEITTLSEIYAMGKRIEEIGIIDELFPDLKNEVIEIESVQRMTKNNRKQKFRVTVVVGDQRGSVGVGMGKDSEVKAAIEAGIVDAKKNMIPVMLGCGSWQCDCHTRHSILFSSLGRCGGVQVILKSAPRGTGIVASEPIKKMLELGGVKDIWSSSRGHTKIRHNTLFATADALKRMLNMKNLQQIVKT